MRAINDTEEYYSRISYFYIERQRLETTTSPRNHLHVHGVTQGYDAVPVIFLYVREGQTASAQYKSSF